MRTKGYGTAREKSVVYAHRDRRRDAVCSMRGLIDLYARNKDHKIAVEFDNGKRLKFKSIEKMNNSDADVLVGVIVGGSVDKGVSDNLQRYSEVSNNNPSVNKDVWLIILSESRIERLRSPRNAPIGPNPLISAKADSERSVRALTWEKGYQQRLIEEY